MRNQSVLKGQSVGTIVLIAANVITFFVLSFIGRTEEVQFMLNHGAMYVPYVVEAGEYYRLFTAMFLHYGFSHLMGNMIMLGIVGWNLEKEIGTLRFVIIYLGSGLVGNIASALWDIHLGEYAVSAGASGAVFGIMGALLYVAIRNRGRVGSISGVGILGMIVLMLFYGFVGVGVDNMAHIAGIIAGFLLAVLLVWRRKNKGKKVLDYER